MALLFGYGTSGVSHDFVCYNGAGLVWNGSAFTAWVDADFASYRVPAVEAGSSGRFSAVTEPTGAVATYTLNARGVPDVAPEHADYISQLIARSYVVWDGDTGLALEDMVDDVGEAVAEVGTDLAAVAADVTAILAQTTELSGETGDGDTPVNHDFGGDDELRVTTAAGAGIGDATISAYLTSDFSIGNFTDEFLKGRTTTDNDGRWRDTLMLSTGAYTLVVAKPRVMVTRHVPLTVS